MDGAGADGAAGVAGAVFRDIGAGGVPRQARPGRAEIFRAGLDIFGPCRALPQRLAV